MLLLRNTSNIAYPGPLDWRDGARHSPILSMFENGPRMRKIIDENIVPLATLARQVGMQIMYVVEGWATARNYPQWQRINERFPDTGPWRPWPDSPDTSWLKEFQDEAFMLGYAEAMEELNQVIDIAPPLSPQADDWVVTALPQAHELMCENGKWNLLHAGFDTNYGMFYSSVLGMQAACKSFRGFLLRDCTTGLETCDTVDEQVLTHTSANIMILAIRCYGAQGRDVRSAIRKGMDVQ